jgi:starvation-inducible outer membrane lipoprotein
LKRARVLASERQRSQTAQRLTDEDELLQRQRVRGGGDILSVILKRVRRRL